MRRRVIWDTKYCCLMLVKGLLLVATGVAIVWMLIIMIQN